MAAGYPFIFANESGNQPVSQLDIMFKIAGQQGSLPCTATGTNAITLTSQTNIYVPTAYTDKQIVGFAAAANSTGAVTVQLNGLAFVKLFAASGIQASGGDLTSGTNYLCMFGSGLDGGNGGFIILNATVTAIAQPIRNSFTNLVITNTTAGTPASQIVVTADEVIVETAGGGTARLSTVNVTINANVNGANGLDAGGFAIGAYYVYVIYNGTTIAGLISGSPTSPTLPGGYIYKARVGSAISVAGPKFNNFIQKGRRTQFMVGTFGGNALANMPALSINSGTTAYAGSSTAPTWVAQAWQGVIAPVTATAIIVVLINGYNGGGPNELMIAPNNNYGGRTSLNPPPLYVNAGSQAVIPQGSIVPETSNLYIWGTSSGAGEAWLCSGYEDGAL